MKSSNCGSTLAQALDVSPKSEAAADITGTFCAFTILLIRYRRFEGRILTYRTDLLILRFSSRLEQDSQAK